MSYVLVAEDDIYIQMLIQRKLEIAGFKVFITGDGSEAFSKAMSEPPRIMVLDVMMPGMSGLEVCREIKKQMGAKAPPVIIVSARGQQTDVDAAEAVGADDYIIKPFSPGELLERIQAALSK